MSESNVYVCICLDDFDDDFFYLDSFHLCLLCLGKITFTHYLDVFLAPYSKKYQLQI